MLDVFVAIFAPFYWGSLLGWEGHAREQYYLKQHSLEPAHGFGDNFVHAVFNA